MGCILSPYFRYDVGQTITETERQGPDHQCSPIKVRGPIDLCGPKVPLPFVLIPVKGVKNWFLLKKYDYSLFTMQKK